MVSDRDNVKCRLGCQRAKKKQASCRCIKPGRSPYRQPWNHKSLADAQHRLSTWAFARAKITVKGAICVFLGHGQLGHGRPDWDYRRYLTDENEPFA
jgi:hypothetical protein